jgi:hypothetical protein
MVRIIDDAACNDILHWLDAHSVTLSQGLPAQLLHKRWAEAGRGPGELGSALQRLFAEDWITLTPGSNPPHLRYTVEGFRRLLEAPAAIADVPVAAAPPPAVETPAAPPPAVDSGSYRPHLSELRLRNDILGIYRELRLRADARLIGMTLSRYWQEMGHRAGELRAGLDVLVRDGLLLPRLVGMDRYWQLTRAGEAWLRAGHSPDVLLKRAPPLGEIQAGPSAEEAHRLVARVLAAQTGTVSYDALQSAWAYAASFDDNVLLTGLDLMVRHGHAALAGGDAVEITLNDSGRVFASEEVPRLSKLMATLNRVLG